MADLSAADVQGHFVLKDMIFSFVTTYMLRAVVVLKIPAILKRGPLSVEKIAAQIGAKSPDILHRVLKYLAHKKVFSEQIGPNGEVCYGLNSISRWLEEETQMVLLCTHPHPHTAFLHVDQAILDGGHAYEKAHGVHLWGVEDEEFVKMINDAMISWSELTMSLVLDNYDGFKNAKVLVDVAGGVGMCLEKIIQKYPHIKGINLELPRTAAAARKTPGVTNVGGDMCKSIPEGDTVLIKSLFINIGDEEGECVLRNAWKALPKGGKLILIELIHTKDGTFENVLDVLMLGYCSGGKARSVEEFTHLLTKCGFGKISVKNVPSKEQVIEAYKV